MEPRVPVGIELRVWRYAVASLIGVMEGKSDHIWAEAMNYA